ncbi:P-loop containing nucleoside triphosphate hydrolase protein [Patellaria atrata CBS 101060]|uniref:Kinesin-like protein n=1 Tax=Patellaria atrata CBS 101060 TaxID=1346257 RepID=A0A9P4S4H4_9PEZI|nr:P-loop containing nucleoside triphosphate hydrolase protein [Patellaria atrata CBS 101060]
MDSTQRPSASLFDVFLRLRPSPNQSAERFLDVEINEQDAPTHITIKPPSNDHRKRAVEKFAFTRVFEEDAAQIDLFKGIGVIPLIEGVVGPGSRSGRDGLLATLGVTGSGKSHTILGSKSQRGLTQMSLDVLFKSIDHQIIDPTFTPIVFPSIAASDVSEAQILPASIFLDSLYGDGQSERGYNSRAQTPMPVCSSLFKTTPTRSRSQHHTTCIIIKIPNSYNLYPRLSNNMYARSSISSTASTIRPVTTLDSTYISKKGVRTNSSSKDASSFISTAPRSNRIPRPSTLPQTPSVNDVEIEVDSDTEYAIVISMFEVYNDRIFDLLTQSATSGRFNAQKRRALLFKSTEHSPDRKVVAGLRKVICGSFEEALMVLETGLTERRVAGTGSNAVSSRSHGFFNVEVKKRRHNSNDTWSTSTLTIVDLAGSERARNAKTAGATLAEAGKINESLMYLGQCMQMQSDAQDSTKQTIVPYRQCKLTELLFSNSFPSHHHRPRDPQKAIMIVTADPIGDFNATSQILRYSALAREVTVPRIPSYTSTILSPSNLPRTGRVSPSAAEDLDAEILRLAEQLEIAHLRLREEESRRRAAEASWRASESRLEGLEAAVREECFAEMDARLETERRRWQGAWAEETDRNEEHIDAKIELLSRVKDQDEVVVYEDREEVGERARELEVENERLRERVGLLERERVNGGSPVKRMRVLKARKWEVDMGGESP